MNETELNYPTYAKIIHLGLAAFGITAYLTGELAEGGTGSTGYLLHAYLGLSLAFFMVMRLVPGLTGSESMRFGSWSIFSARQWKTAFADIRALLSFKVPERGRHEGLAGLVQAFGLMIFGLMAASGTALFVLGGGADSALFEAVEELHELGESLIPLYLLLHVGAVILHTIAGSPVWKRMFSFSNH